MTAASLGAVDLLPCPFCGGKPDENAIEAHTHSPLLKSFGISDHKGSHVIECGCGAGLIDETRAAVVAHWNTRAAALTPAAGGVEPVAWWDGGERVINRAAKEAGERSGGATKSATAAYTVPLFAAPPPADAVRALVGKWRAEMKTSYGGNSRKVLRWCADELEAALSAAPVIEDTHGNAVKVNGVWMDYRDAAAPTPEGDWPWLPLLGALVCEAKDRDLSRDEHERRIDTAHTNLFNLLRTLGAAHDR